ncbi:hypothetical protein MLD38_009324 [Melastoma candidum]|uniref:Uncharacterized protein n=1 Tax=Melastoma candidum TaxID=119954 RepID=A0ACB9RWB6_9MYRT|nr:hypothetical protein MLD38_009324 [Melastoma candidum]
MASVNLARGSVNHGGLVVVITLECIQIQRSTRKQTSCNAPFETEYSGSWQAYSILLIHALLIRAGSLWWWWWWWWWGITGVALLFRYNDERRVIRKGQGDTLVAISTKGPIIGGPCTSTNNKNLIVIGKDILGNWVLLYFGYLPNGNPGVCQCSSQLILNVISLLIYEHTLEFNPGILSDSLDR